MGTLSLRQVLDMLGTASWHQLGFQTKDDLRQRRYDLSAWPDARYWFSSSGSTGAPVLYPWTATDQEIADATVRKVHDGHVCRPGGTGFVIAPTGLPGMWHHMDRQLANLGVATLFPGVDSPARILALVDQVQPSLLISLPLVLSRLGELRSLRGASPLPTGSLLFAGGDVLSVARRHRIEALWGLPLKNFYGLSEVFGPLAGEAADDGTMVWQADAVFVEILDPSTRLPVSPGEIGVAVLTTLWDRPGALVRYWTGDCFRLRSWLAPGRPCFEMCGREQVRLPGMRGACFPIDLDQALLADPAVATEWSLTAEADTVALAVETATGLDRIDPRTVAAVAAMFDCPVRWQAVSPGALDRSVPKLAVSRSPAPE